MIANDSTVPHRFLAISTQFLELDEAFLGTRFLDRTRIELNWIFFKTMNFFFYNFFYFNFFGWMDLMDFNFK